MTDMPSVSIVLPALNERSFIRDCLDALIDQDYPDIKEILVVDGGSTDGTRELVRELGGVVRLIDNPRVTAAAAMNIGTATAACDVICRADAHTVYASDYVARCVEALVRTGAVNAGGPMRPVGTTSFGRAVAAVTSSPLGVGPGRFHYSDVCEEVDTVYLGTFWKQTLLDVGGYDEEKVQWAAEDQELNLRLRQGGGTIVLDPAIRSWYFPRGEPRALARQYFNYGVCKASTLAKHRTLPSWRPLAPAALVTISVLGLVLGRRWPCRVAVPAIHAAASGAFAWRLGTDPGVAPHRAFWAVQICHWSYGAGFLSGLERWISGRGFDARPRRRR